MNLSGISHQVMQNFLAPVILFVFLFLVFLNSHSQFFNSIHHCLRPLPLMTEVIRSISREKLIQVPTGLILGSSILIEHLPV